MSFPELLVHLGNFFLAPLAVAALLLLLAKGLVWRQLLRATSWGQLFWPSAALACLGQLLGLVVLGHEGKLASYALWLGLACLPLGWKLMRS